MNLTSEHLAAAALTRVFASTPAPPELTLSPATEVWQRLRAQDSELAAWGELSRSVDPEQELERADAIGVRFVCRGDDEFPAWLADTLAGLVTTAAIGAPWGLWLAGPVALAQAVRGSAGLAGSRSCTPYGDSVSAEFGHDLAARGLAVWASSSYGIDAAAVRGALAADGTAVVVMAGGADSRYPKGNSPLLERVKEGGLLVSTLPVGCSPTRSRFMARCRLQASLTDATLIVEAARRSGALSVAAWAHKAHRPVLAVPGPITSAQSDGTHDLIRSGTAELVCEAAQVAARVGSPIR